MGFWVGVVADTGLMTKVAGNYATLNYIFDSPKNNEWFYFTAVFAENESTNSSTTGGVTYYINNTYIGYKATGGGLSLNKQNWEIGKKLIDGHGDSNQQPSGDLASLVIKNKPLENIQDYKYLHDFNKAYGKPFRWNLHSTRDSYQTCCDATHHTLLRWKREQYSTNRSRRLEQWYHYRN